MAFTSTIKVNQLLNKVTLTPITSNPLHESMKILQKELKPNTMSVLSKSDQYGHLVLSITPADYLLKTPDAFKCPPKPGTGPNIAQRATTPAITQAHW